jgi:4'-phosphopantetheinyl transferase EntD
LPPPIEEELHDWLRDTFGGFVGIATARLDRMYPLLDGEEAAIAKAVERRRIEFSVGRWCARQALQHTGIDPQPIPVGPRGAPVWPEGACGSITHSGAVCAAVAALTTEVEGLGLDVVDLADASATLVSTAPVFAQAAEIEAAKSLLAPDEVLPLAVLFSAKETAIKAMTESLDRYVEFTEVLITLEESSFSASLAAKNLSVMGWWTACNGYVFTAAARH